MAWTEGLRSTMVMDVEHASAGILSVVLAGGKGSRLHDLTRGEAKPALPIGADARLIDFTLANVVNSGIRSAMVLTQYAPATLHDHVQRCWASGTGPCAFTVLDGAEHGPFSGTADAVARVIAQIDRHAPRHIVVLGGDHVYQMDYRPFIDRHLACDAEVTIGVVHVPVDQASGLGVLAADVDFRVTDFAEKPSQAPEALDRAGQALASMGIYVFAWPVLRRMLLDMSGIVPELDFGEHIIPALVAKGTAVSYALPGRDGKEPLWRDLGTLDAYHLMQRHLVDGSLKLDPSWPVTYPGETMLADCGSVGLGSALLNVILLPGARVGRSAALSDAIIMGDAIVPDGFNLEDTIARHGAWCTTSTGGIRVISADSLTKLALRQRHGVVPAITIDMRGYSGTRSVDCEPERLIVSAVSAV